MSTMPTRSAEFMDGRRIPLQRYGLVSVTDSDQALEYCRRGFPLVERFGFSGKSRTCLASADTWLSDIRVSSVCSSGHHIEIADDRHVTLIVPLRQHISVNKGRHEVNASSGSMLVIAPGQRHTSVAEGYVAGLIKIPVNRVHSKLQSIRQCDKPISLVDLASGHDVPALISLRSFAGYVLDELDSAGALVSHSSAQIAAANLLVELVGLALAPHMEAQPASEGRPYSSARHVTLAEEFIRSNADWPIMIGDVAGAIGISVRALQLAFRTHRGTTPVKFLNEVRLENVHRKLSSPLQRGSVTHLAFECGITHLGRFAAHYRRKFGELPSETRRRVNSDA